jgi:hypothetical protein
VKKDLYKMHFCSDEALAISTSIPIIGVFFRKLHKWYHSKTHHKCHEKDCQAEHVEHDLIDLPIPTDCVRLTVEEVDVRFGSIATILLMFDRKMLETKTFSPHSEFVWFLSSNDVLTARWNNKLFVWEQSSWKREYTEADLVQQKLLQEQNKAEHLLTILRSISNFSVKDKELDVWFDDGTNVSSIREFVSGSFTRELLQLIEDHLLDNKEHDSGQSNSGLGQEQKTDSGSPQSN